MTTSYTEHILTNFLSNEDFLESSSLPSSENPAHPQNILLKSPTITKIDLNGSAESPSSCSYFTIL